MMSAEEIVIVSCVFPPEPLVSARMSEAIATFLSKDEKVVVLCPKPCRPAGSIYSEVGRSNLDYEVVTLKSYICPESKILGRLKESYSFGKAVVKYIDQHHKSIKAIYANTHPTFSQYLLLNAANKYRIPCVLHIQDLYPESITIKSGVFGKFMNPLLVKIDSQYMNKARKLIAISADMKDELLITRKLDNKKVDVIYNWQDEKIFTEIESSENSVNKFTFMFLGNINPTANIQSVIHAFGQIANNNARLIIAGNGSEKSNCQEVAKQYPDADIAFTEVIPKEVPELQSKADVLLLPLLKGISKTAMPSKIPAYMFSSKPILACVEKDSEIGRIIHNTNCGWIIEPENIESLSKQMAECIDVPRTLLSQIGANGRNFGLNNFSKSNNLKKICNLIKELGNGSETGVN